MTEVTSLFDMAIERKGVFVSRGTISPLPQRREKLCRVRGPHTARDFGAAFAFDHRDIILALQIEPELRGVAEVMAEPHRRVSGDRAPSVQDIGNAAGRYTDVECKPIGAKGPCAQFTF